MNIGTFDGFGSPKEELKLFPVMVVRDEKSSGTAGGTSLTGSQQRTLNTVQYNSISGASLASNAVTLPSGTYLVFGSSPCYKGDAHEASLYNSSDSAVIIPGTSEVSNNADAIATRSRIAGVFTITQQKTIRLDHYITTGVATNGLGLGSAAGYVEVYAELTIIKVA